MLATLINSKTTPFNHNLELITFRHDNFSRRDRELQLSRRLDWRFLLPDPHLGRVAYFGSGDGDLQKALTMFSESLIIISQPHQFSRLNDAGSTFDLVVFRSLNNNALRLIAGLLKPGGLLYWEIDRSIGKALKGIRQKKGDFNVPIPPISLSWHLGRYRSYLSLLEELGFRNMQIYWHRPNFDHGLEMIPLHNSAALKNIFSRAKGSFTGRLKLAAGRFLMSMDLLKYFVPCISVVACKKESINR
jgi:hypothetical protein